MLGLSVVMAAAMISDAAAAAANLPLVFISSFKPGAEGAIHAFRLEPRAGRLTPIGRVADVENSYFITLSPDRKFLYSLHAKEFGSKEHEQIAAFAIHPQTGGLKPLNRQSTLGSASCYLHVDPTGKTLLVANYVSGGVASLPVKQDGSLGEVISLMQHAGPTSGKEPQERPHAHCLVPSPDNRFACAADLGLDQVLVYRLDAPQARLARLDTPPAKTPPGAGPRHLTFHPNGRFLYVINELGGSITVFDYKLKTAGLTQRQTLSTLPDGYKGKNACADVKITPNGRFLYGTNRGHDSIAIYRVQSDGQLSLVEIASSLGKEPQNLAITSDGALLLCANLGGNNVSVFRIDAESGRLISTGPSISVPSPSCIQLIP